MKLEANFWQTKSLREMTKQEWEALCDGCGLCCLHKLQDEDTNEVVYTRVVCEYLDLNILQCKDYSNRSKNVPSCVPLNVNNLKEFDWLPETCSYNLVYKGRPLPAWHYLISGSKETIKKHNQGLHSIEIVVNSPDRDEHDYIIY